MRKTRTCKAHGRRRCVECPRKATRVWAAKNRPHLAEYTKKRRQENIEKSRAAARAYYATPKGRRITRNANLRKRFFTIDLFESRLHDQKYRCAICRRSLKALPPREIHADHDHTLRSPRGVLCYTCNLGLGNFFDRPFLLLKAIRYLEDWKLWRRSNGQ